MGGETTDDSVSDFSEGECESNNKKSAQKKKVSRKTIVKRRDQKYRSQWEKLPQFRLWLCPNNSNVFKATCRYCDTTMKAELSV